MTIYNEQPLLQSGGAIGGIQRPGGTGFVQRGVTGNELVSNQLNDLLDSDSRYIQQARARSAQQAASRGLLNSSIAAGAGESAAIDAGLPIATADAQQYGLTARDNMGAENDYLLRSGDWTTQLAGARIGAAASRANAELNFRLGNRELDVRSDQFDREFDRDDERYDTDWERQIQGTLLGNELGQQTGFNAQLWETVFGDPSLWRDPAGASGFMEYWQGQFDTQLDEQMAPYLEQFGLGDIEPIDPNRPRPRP